MAALARAGGDAAFGAACAEGLDDPRAVVTAVSAS